MSKLTPAQQEALYDAQRNGSAYVKPEPADTHSPLFYELKDWIDQHFDAEEDLPLTIEEKQVLDILVPPAPPENPSPLLLDLDAWAAGQISTAQYVDRLLASAVVEPARDETHRRERWAAIRSEIAALQAEEQAEIVLILEELERRFDVRRATHTASLGG